MKWYLNRSNPKKIESIMKSHNVSEEIARIIENRRFNNRNELKNFLHPKFNQFHNPFLMKGMEETVKKILKTIKQQKNIFIFGDNDADGISATSILFNKIKDMGGKVKAYIPNRKKEGRGFSKKGVKEALKYKADILITCDCGTNNYESIEYANQNNLDIIITDHHLLTNKIPNVFSMLNPNQSDCKYPFKNLSGSGVAFKLIQGLTKEKENIAEEAIQIAMLGTLSDMVPLVNENRLIVYFGLKNIIRTKNIGLKKTFQSFLNKNIIKVSDITSQIIPKINSVSRIGDSNTVLKLLTFKEKNLSSFLFDLKYFNNLRINIQKNILNEVNIFIDNNIDLRKDKIIICHSNEWEYGILGLIASKIRNQFNRPVILITFNNSMIGQGSARSIKGFNLLEALNFFESKLISFGGHEMASGFLIKKSIFDRFKKSFLAYANRKLKIINFEKKWNVDLSINLLDIKPDFVSFIKKLEPFGLNNNKPLFLTKKLKVIGNPIIFGEGEHIKFFVRQNKKLINVIGYGMVNIYDILIKGAFIDMIFNIEINNSGRKHIIQLNAKDIRLSGTLKLN